MLWLHFPHSDFTIAISLQADAKAVESLSAEALFHVLFKFPNGKDTGARSGLHGGKLGPSNSQSSMAAGATHPWYAVPSYAKGKLARFVNFRRLYSSALCEPQPLMHHTV